MATSNKGSVWIERFSRSIAVSFIALYSMTGFSQSQPTFSRDVAPILQRSCQQCHNPAGIGPMQLITYEQVRPWATVIKDRVTKRIMPPWHVAKNIGIQEFQNDVSLSDAEIELIAAWADTGAPEGNKADLPPPIEFGTGSEWELADTLGPPDVVLSSVPFNVIANGQDQWWNPRTGYESPGGERWLRASEFKPSFPLGKKVVHHGHAVLVPDGERRQVALARYGVGKAWEMYPEGVGMRVPAKGHIEWDLHYFPVGAEGMDVVEVGLWFYDEGTVPEEETVGEVMFRVDGLNGMARGQDILIPPHGYQVLHGTHVLQNPAVIQSFRPHLHMRGKLMSMEAIYPDGSKEVLSEVNKYNHNWQISYIFADHVRPLLPAGTVLQFTSVFDNTVNNPLNPDPNQWVLFGRRGVDEMSHAWIGITYMDEEQFQRVARERAAALETLTVGN